MNGPRRISFACRDLVLVPFLVLVGCDDSVGPDTVEAVSISPAGSIELSHGNQLQLAAAVVNHSGSMVLGDTRLGSFSAQDCLLFSEVQASGWELEPPAVILVRIDVSLGSPD